MEVEMLCMKCEEKFAGSKDHFQCPKCKKVIKIDKRVKPLVIALNQKGFYTAKSCQGHSRDVGWPFPFVTLYFQKDYQLLKELLHDYNQQARRGERWEISRHPKIVFKKWIVPARRKGRRLETLQKSVEPLTSFLLKKPSKNVL